MTGTDQGRSSQVVAVAEAREHHHEHHHEPEAQVRRWVDYLGAGVGLLCAVHCALAPMALILSPIAGVGLLWSEAAEGVMLWSLIVLALVSGGAAAIKSKRLTVVLGFAISISLVLVSHELAEHDHGDAIGWPLASSILGGLGVMLCHLWSLKLQRARACCAV